MKKKLIKKLFLLLPLMSPLIISVPFILTSCSSISKELVNKTVWKESGDKFAQFQSSDTANNLNFGIESITKKALETDVGLKSLSDNLYGKLALNWLKNTINDPEQKNIKKQYDEQLKNIDKEYTELYKSSKNSYGANFSLKFQQEVLDLNGGSESSWKEKKLINYAKTELSSKLFANNYLSIIKKENNNVDVIYFPNQSEILKAVTKTDGYDFAFNAKAKGESKFITKLDEEFAKFQQFIFDKWVEKVNPFVVNMSLWKYGTPIEGITSIYNNKATGNDDSATKNPGTYAFPYFSDVNHSQNSGSTITKFKNFINDAKLLNENFVDKDAEKSKLGLRNIDVKKYTDDGSTLIFVKNGSIYNDLYIEFAAASSYLFGKTYNSSAISNDISDNWKKEIKFDTTSANGFDAITQNFISLDSLGSITPFATNSNGIKIKNTLFKQMINDQGPLKNINNDVLTVDIIKPDPSNKLDDFLFIRDEAGVHALAIEGQKFITNGSTGNVKNMQKAANKKEAAERASRIVLYHYFLKKLNDINESVSQTISIEILDEIKKFFEENTNYLVAEYMSSTSGGNSNQNLFKFPSENNLNIDYKKIYDNLGKYIFDLSTMDKVKEYNEKMLNQKTKYSNNYGDSTLKNGLSSRWSYNKATGTNVFDVAKSIEMSTNPFQENTGSYKKYIDSISDFVNSLKLQPLRSNFEGFKYSQYIYTNNNLINNVLLSYGSDGQNMGNNIKIDILNEILKENFDIKTLKFSKTFENVTDNNNDVITALNHAFVNSYITKTFDALTNKWVDYEEPTPQLFNKSLTTNLDDYKIKLFKKTLNSNNSNAIEEKVNTLTMVATVKYLLDNNAEKFLNYLKSKVSFGKDSYVAWLTSYNSELTKQVTSNQNPYATPTPPKSEEVLKESNMQKNFNNTFESAYTVTGNNSTPTVDALNNEVGNAVFGNTNDSNNYYSFNDGKLGYLGLINDTTSINSDTVKKILFEGKSTTINNINDAEQGLLFSYGSKSQLLATIENYQYESQVNNLAEDLVKKVNKLDISEVIKATGLNPKKNALKTLVSSSAITDTMFTRKNTYVGKNDSSKNINVIQEEGKPNIQSAAYVYQINVDDLTNWDKFKDIFKKTSTINQSFKQTTYAYDVIYNLLFDAAKESYLQEEAITSLMSENNNKWKVNVYDTRLNQQLGPKWALNWKN